VTWQAQGENLEQKLKELHDKVPGQSAPQRASTRLRARYLYP
jgi:hypothetical protein